MCLCVYIYICVCVSMSIYIYIYRERESETGLERNLVHVQMIFFLKSVIFVGRDL